jgi:hypothetical protein
MCGRPGGSSRSCGGSMRPRCASAARRPRTSTATSGSSSGPVLTSSRPSPARDPSASARSASRWTWRRPSTSGSPSTGPSSRQRNERRPPCSGCVSATRAPTATRPRPPGSSTSLPRSKDRICARTSGRPRPTGITTCPPGPGGSSPSPIATLAWRSPQSPRWVRTSQPTCPPGLTRRTSDACALCRRAIWSSSRTCSSGRPSTSAWCSPRRRPLSTVRPRRRPRPGPARRARRTRSRPPRPPAAGGWSR